MLGLPVGSGASNSVGKEVETESSGNVVGDKVDSLDAFDIAHFLLMVVTACHGHNVGFTLEMTAKW